MGIWRGVNRCVCYTGLSKQCTLSLSTLINLRQWVHRYSKRVNIFQHLCFGLLALQTNFCFFFQPSSFSMLPSSPQLEESCNHLEDNSPFLKIDHRQHLGRSSNHTHWHYIAEKIKGSSDSRLQQWGVQIDWKKQPKIELHKQSKGI